MLTLPHFAVESVRDFMRVTFTEPAKSNSEIDDRAHLEAAVTYLERSIKHCNGQASSKGYRVGKGWLPAYRETTGYIIPTFLNLSEKLERPELAETSERMGEWLAQVQEPSGGFIERDLRNDNKPIVFNTGQILHGFNALIQSRNREDMIGPARRAANFLVASADDTGSFVRNEHCDIVHAYNVRSAWALLNLGKLLGERAYEKAALANCDWTIAQQTENGFFLNNVFEPGWNANTHGIAYVLQGVLEIYCVTRHEPYLKAVQRTADSIVARYGSERRLASELGENWEFRSSHVCLTGYAQLAIVLLKLFDMTSDRKYRDVGLELLGAVAGTQDLASPSEPHYGGIKGSLPIYGRYAPLQYPNWATKFFIDALLTKSAVMNEKSGQSVNLLIPG